MSVKVTLPQLGESVHEGTIGQWLKQVGDQVEEYEPLVEVITDKVNAEVPSPVAGTLTAILVKEGETVEVGTVIGEMQAVGATVAASVTQAAQAPAQAATSGAAGRIEAAFAPASSPQSSELNRLADMAQEEVEASFPNGKASGGWYEDEEEDTFAGSARPSAAPPPAPDRRHRYTPVVRRIAQEHNLDLDKLGLRGSGSNGRVTRDDLLMYLEQQRRLQQPVPTRALPRTEEPAVAKPPAAVPAGPEVTPLHDQMAANAARAAETPAAQAPVQPQSAVPTVQPQPSFSEVALAGQTGSRDELVPLTPMRRAIAEHMVRSVQTAPHAWTIVEVDMTRLVRHRAAVKEEFKRREGVELTYLPFVAQAVIAALKEFPMMNAAWLPDGSGIVVKRDINIGIAIDVPDGLVVPVIPRADEKSLVGLARSLNDLITRARSRKLTLADVQGGTFTLNNPGAFGSVMSQPIINQPQAGIVTMESIVKRPVVLTDADGNDSVVVRSMMNMCLSFDHRVVDGATAGRFLQAVKKWLETRDYSAI